MIEIRNGTGAEFCEIIDFLDYVFSKNSRPHDFEAMYPNLYLPTDTSMGNQICLREDGVLKACLLSYPRTLNVNGKKLYINGIGNVACHPRERGRGFMSKLVGFNNDLMRKNGIHASDLGGRRLRYNHFGYDDGGTSYNACIPVDAVKVLHSDASNGKYEFRLLHKEDVGLVSRVKEIYDSKPIHFEYDYDSFFLRLIIPFEGAVSYAVFSSGELLGHISLTGENLSCVREICLKNDSDICDVLFHYCADINDDLQVSFGDWQLKHVRPIFELAYGISTSGSHMWQIIDWKEVLCVLLNFKSSYTSLPEGSLTLEIEKYGKLRIENKNGLFTVEETDRKADVTLPSLVAIGVLTGRSPEIYASACGLLSDTATFFKCWFPIPLTMFGTERV